MTQEFKALPLHALPAGTSYCRPWQEFPEWVKMDTPALEVMTDLRKMSAVTIPPNAPIDRALDKMVQSGVRLLLVIGEERGMLGVITARDIQGEKPVQFQNDMGVSRAEILVRDIMTPQWKVEVLTMADVQEATVGDIVMTLKKDCRQHAIVVDAHKESGIETVRGVFSATHISRLLGVKARFDDISKTFDELVKAFES